MSNFKKSQILVLTFLSALLFVTPLISSSSRPKYIYFIINLLILALGAEAGLFPAFSKPLGDKKVANPTPTKAVAQESFSPEAKFPPPCSEKKARMVEKSVSEKIVNNYNVKVDKLKKSPSMPSLFFIGGGATEIDIEDVVEKKEELEMEVVEEIGGLSRQELFTKAETFIGNFRMQLKMQREESWKRIHGHYHKAF